MSDLTFQNLDELEPLAQQVLPKTVCHTPMPSLHRVRVYPIDVELSVKSCQTSTTASIGYRTLAAVEKGNPVSKP